RQISGSPEGVSPLFSGKSPDGAPLKNHQHAFYWPCDLNGDGKIDHIKVIAPRAHTEGEQKALESLRKIWADGRDLARLILLHALPLSNREETCEAVSATPVVFGRHYKPRLGSFESWLIQEVKRSCVEVGLPEPSSVEISPELPCHGGAPIRWAEFARQRKGGHAARGYGFRLVFPTPVKVPFAIGSMAHFGLGLFFAPQ
ncbi:MAG: type I-U CRISPR-associated protein Cas5/Cas6, partial [Deltaproteobacteria bacterium]|nr:type I-U CRISPR-associated protein Cas5/Cas6 [Deltaproteobacteria bacterium]